MKVYLKPFPVQFSKLFFLLLFFLLFLYAVFQPLFPPCKHEGKKMGSSCKENTVKEMPWVCYSRIFIQLRIQANKVISHFHCLPYEIVLNLPDIVDIFRNVGIFNFMVTVKQWTGHSKEFSKDLRRNRTHPYMENCYGGIVLKANLLVREWVMSRWVIVEKDRGLGRNG